MKLIRIYLDDHHVLLFRFIMSVIFFYLLMEVIKAIITGVGVGNGGVIFIKELDPFGFYLAVLRDVTCGFLFFWLATFGTKMKSDKK